MVMEPIPEVAEAGAEVAASIPIAARPKSCPDTKPLNTAAELSSSDAGAGTPAKLGRGVLEGRIDAALAELAGVTGGVTATVRQGHLALLKRWYYRPEVRRVGEIFFPDAEGRWPVKAILRGVGRVATTGMKAAASGT